MTFDTPRKKVEGRHKSRPPTNDASQVYHHIGKAVFCAAPLLGSPTGAVGQPLALCQSNAGTGRGGSPTGGV